MKRTTVIIPVYNIATIGIFYMQRCVDSVLNQKSISLEDIEILLINDGSKDNSLDILREYEKNHPEAIRVIDQKNIGVAKTRNNGIKMATGEYVTFLDQDDFYQPDALYCMLKPLETDDYDVIQCGYRRVNIENKTILKVGMKNAQYSKYVMSAAWGKLHKRTFLLDNSIEFFDNTYGEDIVFTMNEIFTAKKFKVIPNYIAYNWFFNKKSVSNTIQRGFKENDGFTMLLHKLFELNVPASQKDMYEYYLLRTVIYYLLMSGRGVDKTTFTRKEKELFNQLTKYSSSILNNKYILLGPDGELFSMRWAIRIFIFVHKLKLVGLFARIYCNG